MKPETQTKTRSNNMGSLPRLVLHLVLTHHWFDETERGAKSVEYRKMSDRWRRLIWNRRGEITHVRFSRAYSKTALTLPVERIDIGKCPIPGWDGDYFRIHFFAERPSGATSESKIKTMKPNHLHLIEEGIERIAAVTNTEITDIITALTGVTWDEEDAERICEFMVKLRDGGTATERKD